MAVDTTFNPAGGTGGTLSATTSSSRAALTPGTQSIVVTNRGSDYIYVRCGDSAVVATAADYCVTPGGQISLTKFQDLTHVAVLSVSGTQAVHVIAGEGV